MSKTTNKITALGITFDATKVAPAAAPEPVPSGWYKAAIVSGEISINDNGQGKRMALEWEILEGEFKGRRVFDGINYVHSNAKTQEIGQSQVSAICHAVQTYQIADVSALFNKPHEIKVDVEGKRTVDSDGSENDSNGDAYKEGAEGTKTYDAKNRFRGARACQGATPKAGEKAPAAPKGDNKPAASGGGAGGNPKPWENQGDKTPKTDPKPADPAPAAETGGKPASNKPASKGKPAAKPAPAKAERKFYVNLEGEEYGDLWTESKIGEAIASGKFGDVGFCLEGASEYKTAAEHGIAVPAAAGAGANAPWTQ